MQYRIESEGQQCRVCFEGSLTYEDRDTLRSMLTNLKEKKPREVILDMKALEYIDSSGLGMYLLMREQVESAGGTLQIGPLSEQVEKMFRLSRFI